MKKKEWVWLIGIVLFFTWIYFGHLDSVNDISEHRKFTKVVITSCGTPYKGNTTVNYEFSVNKTIIKLSQAKKVSCEDVINKTFPVIYSSKNPNNCCILINNKDFEEYHLNIEEVYKMLNQGGG